MLIWFVTVSFLWAARARNLTADATVPRVHLKNGTATGLHSSVYNQDFFLGIPFATPPLGTHRFRNPQPSLPWNGTLNATSYAPQCVGYGSDETGLPLSEDCLYLNVIRPSGFRYSEKEKLQVGVWTHGGNFVEGETQDSRYNLSFIVQDSVQIGKPFIGVSIAYRLSGWGFLSSAEVSESGNTNMCLRDQRLALHWIQGNIAAFGGDPRRVTIWGESAGAISIGLHLTAYDGRDDNLFWAAIMESGDPVNYDSFRTAADHQPMYDNLTIITGCDSASDSLDCLRQVDFDVLDTYFSNWASGATPSTLLDPIIDSDIIARWGSKQLSEGAFAHVPLIDGTNTDESVAFATYGINTTAEFAADAVDNSTGVYLTPAELVDELLEHYSNTPEYWLPPPAEIGLNYTYPLEYGAPYRYEVAYRSDAGFHALRRGTTQTWTANGVPAYSYRFNTVPNGNSAGVGVSHFSEVAFVFGNTHGDGYNPSPFADRPESYKDLAFLMSASWASFIHDRDTNSWRKGLNVSAPVWPVYDNASPENIVWDANVKDLAWVEPDTWRKEGIDWIWQHCLAYSR
ncbi:hypothetical protein B0A50_04402 [Salinomyces thailandicus]|uniref:Carboxylic ester hydrolase n=1 Tax=Salinomyces thailandicus TaxID=706561 RepID=A0A4U0TYH1_9PEZI|nr:hypothetical protein B0A50_04402 [Salinomyces thailandica]